MPHDEAPQHHPVADVEQLASGLQAMLERSFPLQQPRCIAYQRTRRIAVAWDAITTNEVGFTILALGAPEHTPTIEQLAMTASALIAGTVPAEAC